MMIKYVLIFQICSLLTGQCFEPLSDRKIIESWNACVIKGSKMIVDIIKADPIRFENMKLFVKYWCNEDNSNKTPTSGKQFEKEV